MSEESKRLNPEALLAAYEAHQKHAADPGRKGSGLEKAICAYLDALAVYAPDVDLSEARGAIEHLDRDNQRLRLQVARLERAATEPLSPTVAPKPDPAIAELVERLGRAKGAIGCLRLDVGSGILDREDQQAISDAIAALTATNDRVAEMERERDEAIVRAAKMEDRADAAEERYRRQRDLRASDTDLLRREIDKARAERNAAEAEVSRLKAGAVTDDALPAALFLLDRLDNLERGWSLREFYGHVTPAMARLRSALSNQAGASK